ncbi:MAG: class I SAM-dependent methyltransferase [Ignavibacteriales bacterium]|nr:class I SAM-dependent methyltransferase [Ignavibacteriales bacterium]
MIGRFQEVSEAFSRQSEIFDSYEKGNEILRWMRSVTHEHLARHLKKNDKILELNSGTGLDAVYLAKKGYKIHCTDISIGMLEKLKQKIENQKLGNLISYQLLSFTDLDKLEKNNYDYIFSNFGGLNCVNDLSAVFANFGKILKPGGKVTLVIIPPVCPWELLLALKGNFKTSFRRLHNAGVAANVEGVKFTTYYHSVRKTVKSLGNEFSIIEVQGLASISPPPYMINFPKKYPRFYNLLTRIENKLSHTFPFNHWADHFIITAEYHPTV